MKKILRDYQSEFANKAYLILKEKKIVYLAMEPRCGKTATALETCRLYGAKNVLFLTKKKAISSIQNDYYSFGFDFKITVINDEQLENINNSFDLIIHDEHHRFGAFPKPSKRVKEYKLKYSFLPMIFLSGTPAAESYSQMFHQFWVSSYTPFKQYGSFYKWSKTFVNVKPKHLGHGVVNDYSDAKKDLIDLVIDPYILKYTQKESGFESKVNEHVIYIPELCQNLISKLKKDKVIVGKEETILADSGAKLMQKIHQLESGTIKFESGKSQSLDYSKAIFIRDKFKGKKIAILYYYVEELELLKQVFPNHTNDLNEFNTTDKDFIGQMYSSAMGINLSSADCLVFYSFGFSGSMFIQAIDRLTTKDRKENDVYFVFGKGSLTEKIYKVVSQKKNFTEAQFKKYI
jgi:hypothetical protein